MESSCLFSDVMSMLPIKKGSRGRGEGEGEGEGKGEGGVGRGEGEGESECTLMHDEIIPQIVLDCNNYLLKFHHAMQWVKSLIMAY